MAHFSNRPLSDDGFIISNLKGLAFNMTCIIWTPSSVASSGRRIPIPSILFRLGCIDVQLRSLFYSCNRLPAHVPDHYSTNKAARGWSIAQTYIKKGFADTRAIRIGGCVRYRMISSNAYWQASSQMNEIPFFNNLVKGWHHLERFEINLWIYASSRCWLSHLPGDIWETRTLWASFFDMETLVLYLCEETRTSRC